MFFQTNKRFYKAIRKIKCILCNRQIGVFNRHPDYHAYLSKQEEKTLDNDRIKLWLGEEWEIKLAGLGYSPHL